MRLFFFSGAIILIVFNPLMLKYDYMIGRLVQKHTMPALFCRRWLFLHLTAVTFSSSVAYRAEGAPCSVNERAVFLFCHDKLRKYQARQRQAGINERISGVDIFAFVIHLP